ncbi:MAG: zinc ribbon domain-containing protein [Myxococcota bacterium]
MPSYDYRCTSCGKEMEISHRMSDPPQRICPACGADALERLVSRSSFALKGSGWYSDGYGASGGSSSSSSSSSASTSAPAAAESTKPKSEPAPAAEKKEATPSAPAPSKPEP